MMARDRSGADIDAADADVQEQERLPVEEGIDPERQSDVRAPDGFSVEADPADVQEQSEEVPEDDDYPDE